MLTRYDQLSQDHRGLFPYTLGRVRLFEYEHLKMRLCGREDQVSASVVVPLLVSSSLVRRF